MDTPIVDFLQYCRWSSNVYEEMQRGRVAAVHVTIAYHERFREVIDELTLWHRRFDAYAERIFHGTTAADIDAAIEQGRTAVFFGFQNCAPIDEDLGLIRIWHELGVRVMQLTYNAQSVLASGCYEPIDSGLTRFGRAAIQEMNRIGMIIDMSHSAAQSTLETIAASRRPIVISHANPAAWHDVPRNKGEDVLRALADSGGMMGFSLYPHHLADGNACTLASFCAMVARTAEIMGVGHIGFGSDLCQGRNDATIDWMRRGRHLPPSQAALDAGTYFGDPGATLPAQQSWFQTNADYPNVLQGLRTVGFNEQEIAQIAYKNWRDFLQRHDESVIL